MLTFRNIILFFGIILAGLILSNLFIAITPWIYIGIVIAVISLLACGAISMKAGMYITSVGHLDTDENILALTFDDGPDEKITPMVLDILKKHDIRAVFFLIGSKAEKYPDIVRRMDEEGHALAGHSYSHHFFFDLFSADRMLKELKKTEEIIAQVTGKRIRLFRPPYGVTNPTLARVIKVMGYQSIGWSLKSRDTVVPEKETLLGRLNRRLKPGDIVLFHDSMPVLPEVLDAFITRISDRKMKLVRLDQFLNIKTYG
jgi:peptidoglycan/xylan/chitin deacetylase (PgdA/CDA1 family)